MVSLIFSTISGKKIMLETVEIFDVKGKEIRPYVEK